MMNYRTERQETANYMQRLYRQKLTTTSGGNLSMRLADNLFLLTPSASDKGNMQAEEIGLLDGSGAILEPEGFRPSIEGMMHLAIYNARPDVDAIVHAHPVTCSAFAATNAEIKTNLLAESYAIIRDIAYVPYYPMGSQKLATAVGEISRNANCLLMRNHGVLTMGKNLLQAFDRLEVMEAAATVTMLVNGNIPGSINELPEPALSQIDEFMKRNI